MAEARCWLAQHCPRSSLNGSQPAAFIQDGVFVFEGTFQIPLAAALVHIQRSESLLKAKHFDQALAEAQTAASLAPDAFQPQIALGDALTAMHRSSEAHTAYEKALLIAQAMEPSAQEVWIPTLQKKLTAM